MIIQTSGSRQRPSRQQPVDAEALIHLQALLEHPLRRDKLIEYLHQIQDRHGKLSQQHLGALAEMLKLAPVEVFEVASFYHHFTLSDEDTTSTTLRVCNSLSCCMQGSSSLIEQTRQALGNQLNIEPVSCVGRCADAPVAVLGTNPIPRADVRRIRQALDRSALQAPATNPLTDYRSYRRQGGYQLLQNCQSGSYSADSLIQTLADSGLRGLGGAGFPVGQKWSLVKAQPGPRYLAVNIDEGEPGTFKDRFYLEQDPHRILEGALLAAWATQCDSIMIYLRDEYTGIRQMLEQELIALNASTPGPLPVIELRRGAGAYICGEESAMLESLEGKRGMPRQRPPYVAERGLFGRPTLVHNAETLYWIREVVERGSQWFSSQGRHGRHGLRTYSLSGRVQRPGVYLAPAGITARELIDEYGGGMLPGHHLYGYFPGGASGGILPAHLDDLPLDFDTLTPYGCFIGSAAVIIFSQQDRATDLALNAMRFFAHESCGQCTPCRVGTVRAAELMQRTHWDLPLLKELASTMQEASICGLGQAAPNPLLCVIRYFSEELN